MLAMLYGCMTKLDNYEKIKIKQQLKTIEVERTGMSPSVMEDV